jgi:hypothetical protein
MPMRLFSSVEQVVYVKLDSSKKEKKISLAGLALPSRSPENGFYVQGGLTALFKTYPQDSTLRASNVYLFGLYSQLKQYRISLGGDVFTKNENYYINGWYYYSYLPELFFGTGNRTSPQHHELIDYQLWYLDTKVFRRFYRQWFAGLSYTYEQLNNLHHEPDGIAARQTIAGLERYRISGLGIRIRHDSRDFLASSNKGWYLDLHYSSYTPTLGSQYTFGQVGMDLRRFQPLSSKKVHTLAFQLLALQSWGQTPFRYLPAITTRGYHPNLFRDNMLITLQAEYRLMIWKWLGASFFGGLSNVAPAIDQVRLDYLRENYGAGLRIRLHQKHNMFLRIEYGTNRYTSNYYLSLYDAF